ncbi:MAG: hypothetical protein ACKVJK_06630 [Methylophagaceae bacterium]
MEIQLNIPDYLSVKQWKSFLSLDHLSDSEKMIKMVSLLSGKEVDEIKTWTPMSIKSGYAKVLETITDIDPSFYPIFELDGVKYGYSSMTNMTLGEYVDLERLAKQPQENLEQIMAILYRPIVKDKFKGIKWAFKNTFKIGLGEAENLFKYYTLEEYDSSIRTEQADKLSVLPASMALGALSFFLVVGTTFSLGSNLSSLPPNEAMATMKEINKQMASMNIGDGLLQFITSQVHPSYQSQEMTVSHN